MASAENIIQAINGHHNRACAHRAGRAHAGDWREPLRL